MSHLNAEAVLRYADGELGDQERATAERHLAECDLCQQRLQTLLSTMRALPSPLDVIPCESAEARRESLRKELQAAGNEGFQSFFRPSLLLRAAAVVALLGCAFLFRGMYAPLSDSMAAYESTGPRPDHALTPGAVREATLDELCGMDDDNLDPDVSPEMQRSVFAAYGIPDAQTRNYQVDYLINPQLGGSGDRKNLWPEPYHATVWNAKAKDALETRLHRMVCSGSVTLQDAQHDLAANWIEAYKRAFHASRPVQIRAAVDRRALR